MTRKLKIQTNILKWLAQVIDSKPPPPPSFILCFLYSSLIHCLISCTGYDSFYQLIPVSFFTSLRLLKNDFNTHKYQPFCTNKYILFWVKTGSSYLAAPAAIPKTPAGSGKYNYIL